MGDRGLQSSSLVRSTSIRDVEESCPSLKDDSEWAEFIAQLIAGDVLWEYESLHASMGFVSGEGCIAIVRNGQIIHALPLSAFG